MCPLSKACQVVFVLVIIIVLWISLSFNSNKREVIWFHRPDCPHCVAMSDEWNKFESLCRFTSITPRSLNINEAVNQAMAENYRVTSVPHIIKVYKNGEHEVYYGDRTAEALKKWA